MPSETCLNRQIQFCRDQCASAGIDLCCGVAMLAIIHRRVVAVGSKHPGKGVQPGAGKQCYEAVARFCIYYAIGTLPLLACMPAKADKTGTSCNVVWQF